MARARERASRDAGGYGGHFWQTPRESPQQRGRGIRYFSPPLPSSLPRSIIVYANRHRRGGGLKQSSRNPALLSRSADFLCSIGERAAHWRRRPTLTPKRRVIGIIRDPEPPRRRAAVRCKVHADRLNAVHFAVASRGSVFARVSFGICDYPDRWSEYFNRRIRLPVTSLHIRGPPRHRADLKRQERTAEAEGRERERDLRADSRVKRAK